MANSDIINPFQQVTDAATQPAPVDPTALNPFATDYKAPKGSFGLGVRDAAQGLKGVVGGVAAATGDALGSDKLKNYGLEIAHAANDRDPNEAPAPSFSKIKSMSDAVEFAKYGAGFALPNALAAVAAGLVGRAAGGTLAKGVADAGEAMWLKNAGTVAGLETSNIAQQVGTIYPEAVNQKADHPLARAVVGGIAAGTIGTLPETYIAARAGLLGKELAGGSTKGIATAALREAGIAGTGSAVTGAVQTGIQRAAAGQSIDDAEALTSYVDNAGLGLVGGALGGGAAGITGHQAAEHVRSEARPAAEATQTEATPLVSDQPAQETQPVRTPFRSVADITTEQTQARAKDLGFDLTPEQASTISPLVPDTVTGFHKPDFRVDTVKRAQEHVVATGEDAHYVEGDIANLGGLNHVLGHSGANEIYRAQANIFADKLHAIAPESQFFRHGGDEISGVVVNATSEQVTAAANAAKEQVKKYVSDKGLSDIIHTKHPNDDSRRGTGLNIGISKIDAKTPVNDILSQADRIVESSKEGLTDVNGKTIEEAGTVAPEGQPARTEQAVNGSDTAAPTSPKRITAGGTLEAFAGGYTRLLGDITEYRPKSPLTEGTSLEPKSPAEGKSTFAAQLAKLKQNNGELLTHDEIRQARSLDTIPTGTPPLETAPSNARASFKQISPEETRQFIVDTGASVTDQHVNQLVSNGMIKGEKAATTVRTGLNKVIDRMLKQTDVESAKIVLEDGVRSVLKGKINKVDAETIAADYAKALLTTQHNFVSPDLSKPLSSKGTISLFSKSKVDPEHLVQMHNRATSSATDFVTGRDNTGTFGYAIPYSEREIAVPGKATKDQLKQFTDANEDLLALDNHTMLTKYDEASDQTILSVASKSQDFADAVTIAQELGLPGVINLRDMSYVAADGTGSPESPTVRATRFDNIMSQKAQSALNYLNRIVGNPDGLEVRTYVATGKSQGAGAIRLTPTKAVIELALNSQDTLSVAAHEGFHYIEHRVLNDAERSVIERAFAPGSEMFKRLQEQVAKYDYLNGTKISEEVAAVPAEARAYGYEFWRRGELEAPTVIGRLFDKLKSVIGRVANAINGLGFQSHDDIFTAIDRGNFAREGGNPFRSLNLDAEPRPTDSLTLMSRSSLEDLAVRSMNGEVQSSQFHGKVADILGDQTIPEGLRERIFKNGSGELKGVYNSIKRGYLEIFSSGLNLARHSVLYKNVFGVLTAYTQRKSRLIADNVENRLSSWVKGASDADKKAVSTALLERTVNNYDKTSTGYQKLYHGLDERQRTMFDQATDMIAHNLEEEFKAEQQTYTRVLGADSPQFAEWMGNRSVQIGQLKKNGYFPERRYGDHTVHSYIEGADGKKITVYYAQHEREADARAELPDIQRSFAKEPAVKTEYGYKYKAEYDGSLSMSQFLDLAQRNGIDLTQSEKERLATALISADSTRRNRIFKRQNIVGYSDAGMRVLAEFGVSMANKIAYSELGGALNDAMQGHVVDTKFGADGALQISTDKTRSTLAADGEMSGFYRNLADKTADFVMSPSEGSKLSSGLRAAASVQFLGGSFAAGVVQLASLAMNTAPWLLQHTSPTDAYAKTAAGFLTAVTNHKALSDLPTLMDRNISIKGIDEVPGLRQALTTAAQDGTTLDTEIHQIMGLARGQEYSYSGKVQDAIKLWMFPFQWTEKVNRLTTFIAAYKIAKEKNLDDAAAYKMAQETVHGTQFRYDEANRPAIARSPVGALLFTFRSYPIFMTETLVHLAKEKPAAAVTMLAALSLASGVEGMPFAQDIEDLVDTIAYRIFGSSFNSKRAMTNVLKNASEAITGTDLSAVGMHGIANELFDINLASRVGIGDMIPGSRIGAVDADYKSVVQSVLGPVGSMAANYASGADMLSHGQYVEAMKKALPIGAANMIKGAQQWDQGFASDVGGRKLVDVSGPSAILQSLGFSPNSLAKAYEMDQIDKQSLAFYQEAKREFTTALIKAVNSGDTAKAQEIGDAIVAWNQHNPTMPLSFSADSTRKMLQEAGQPLSRRSLMSLPKQLRGSSMTAAGLPSE